MLFDIFLLTPYYATSEAIQHLVFFKTKGLKQVKIWIDKSTNQTIIQTEQNTILDLLNEDITTDTLEFLFEDGYINDNIRN